MSDFEQQKCGHLKNPECGINGIWIGEKNLSTVFHPVKLFQVPMSAVRFSGPTWLENTDKTLRHVSHVT